MEDTLREGEDLWILHRKGVLILVLMEDTLRVKEEIKSTGKINCLNPCFNGRYSQSIRFIAVIPTLCVLILVLMEDTLREYIIRFIAVIPTLVLILVLMEDTLRVCKRYY